MKTIGKIIASLCPFPVEIKYLDKESQAEQRARDHCFDATALKEALPDASMTSMEVGIAKYVEYALRVPQMVY